jgi:16S rRNA (cytosine1402-N4)-methyltransferase
MKNESIEALNLQESGVYVDCTLGYAGDSTEILKRVKRGFLFAFDQDSEAIAWSEQKLKSVASNFEIIKSNFKNLKEELNKRGVNEVDGILFDLGVSSPQLDCDYRGFSYHKNARLDMRMDLSSDFSAYDVVNTYSEDKLNDIIFRYGEEKYARRIAKNIVKKRLVKPIETTFDLLDIIKESIPFKDRRDKHPGKKTFQAIRIEVNHELEVLEIGLKDALSLLKVGGRVVVITFHSLEDKIVKSIFREVSEVDPKLKGLPDVPDELLPDYRIVNNKAIVPTEKELEENNRSRSSKLRIIERIK